ncbi:cytochrome P450, partial [Auriscalpium vulgare]
AMFRDLTVCPEPETFDPERFLTADGPLINAVFGFGKRICPGRFIADSTIFITAATGMSLFHVGSPKGGPNQAWINENVNAGQILARPQPFQCSISPRSAKVEELIMQDPSTTHLAD